MRGYLAYLIAAVMLVACGDKRPEELKQLNEVGHEEAREIFLSLPPSDQVRIVSWELRNRRPSSSRFEYLLKRGGARIAPFLLAEAQSTDNFNVNITMLLIYADMRVLESEGGQLLLSKAVDNCYALGGQGNGECDKARNDLAARMR